MKPAGSGCLILFGLIWCSFILVFDVMIAREVIWEIRAASFPEADATVLSSEVKVSTGSKGKRNYRPRLTYRFRVDGREVISEGRKRSTSFEDTRQKAEKFVREHPPGSPIVIRYDPADPCQSAFDPGLKPGHLQAAMFLTPFHVIGLLFLSPLFSRFRRNDAPEIVTTEDLRMSVKLPAVPPIAVGLGALGGGAFVGILLTIFLLRPLTMGKILGAWGLILLLAAAAYRWQRNRIRSGQHDLVVDAASQTISLPPLDARVERQELPFGDIGTVMVKRLPQVFTRQSRWGTVTHKGGTPQFELVLITKNEAHYAVSRSGNEPLLRSIAESLGNTFGWTVSEPSPPDVV